MGGMIVCPEPLAAGIGGGILARGGNAADAAVAVAFAQGVANPLLCGLAGTAILLHVDRTGRGCVLNGECAIGSGPVPPAWIAGHAGRAEAIGRYVVAGEANQIGPPSMMVPGFVACCAELHRRFGSGRVAWSALIEPSIRLAADGFDVYPYIADTWRMGGDGQADSRPGYPALRRKLEADPRAFAQFTRDDGTGYGVGDRFRQPELADTLDQLARAGAEDFYAGTIGRTLASDLRRRGSLIDAGDLRDYRIVEQPALRAACRGVEIVTTPPPSPGVQVIEMLAILERLDHHLLPRWGSRSVDLVAQVMRAGFVDNRDLKAVALEAAAQWTERILDPANIAAWARRIAGGERVDGSVPVRGTGTTHLVAVDDDGACVSFTHSIGSVAGAGSVTPGLGFLHNNFLGHFDPLPDGPMAIVAGRRIGSGAPTVLRRDDRLRLVLGAPGGSRIITAILQVLLDVIDHATPIEAAVAAPRFHSEESLLVHLEPTVPESTAAVLTALGCTVRRNRYQARVQAIAVDADGALRAGADPRGGAVGRG
ncbi:MAG: gamma-glutamyltransferase [Alphaproteobacteria bacterium]|nr:gamma-glutamyltransferase [Alphaproteobacteria bacterium]